MTTATTSYVLSISNVLQRTNLAPTHLPVGQRTAVRLRLLGRCGNPHFAFFNQRRAFSKAAAEISELGAARFALSFDLDFFDARRMQREHAFHSFAVADAAHRKHFIQAASPPAHDNAGKNLDAFLVAFDDLGVNANGIAYAEARAVFAEIA